MARRTNKENERVVLEDFQIMKQKLMSTRKQIDPKELQFNENYRPVVIRNKIAFVRKECPHPKNERNSLPNDKENKFNSCSICAAEASGQLEEGLTYQEIGDLMGYTKMYITNIEEGALKKLYRQLKNKEYDITKENHMEYYGRN